MTAKARQSAGATRRVGLSPPSAKPPGRAILDGLSGEDRELLHKLLTEPLEYVDHPRLHGPHLDVPLFGVEPKLVTPTEARFPAPEAVADPGLSPSKVPTLRAEQEQTLFLRLNRARLQMVNVLKRFSGQRLTAKATRHLLAWAHWALGTRADIVRMNVPLVLAMAKRTRLSGIDFNELISEGNMALLRSVEKFDCGRGFKFSTYSCRAILKSFSRVAMRAARYRGRFPTEFDPAIEKSDHLERKRENIEIDCVDELKAILLRNLADLSDVERTVIDERFALSAADPESAQPKTLEEVGLIIGVTKERVRQIQNKALQKIRSALEESYLAA
jgi:RNA polymerase primary sigma factor